MEPQNFFQQLELNGHETLQGPSERKNHRPRFPYVVEILVPLGGLGKQLNAMHKFHTQRGMLVLCRPRNLGRAVVMAGPEAQDR